MSERTEPLEDKSIPQLVSRLLDQVTDMVRKEFKLARVELGDKVGQARKGATLAAMGAALAIAGLTLTLAAIAWLLSGAMATWLALLIVGVAALFGAWLCVASGSAKMSGAKPDLERTKRNLEADKKVIKEHVL